MTRLMKAALCAATALACAPAAQAATYVEYTFYAKGAGQIYNANFGQAPFTDISTFSFSFVVDALSPFITSTATGQTYAPPRGGSSFFIENAASISTTSLSVNGARVQRAPDSPEARYSASACGTGSGSFAAADFALGVGCGGLSFNAGFGGGIGYQFSGSLIGLTQRTFEADSAQIGLSGFTTAVPEPSTWALMFAGFGLLGYTMRRRRTRSALAVNGVR